MFKNEKEIISYLTSVKTYIEIETLSLEELIRKKKAEHSEMIDKLNPKYTDTVFISSHQSKNNRLYIKFYSIYNKLMFNMESIENQDIISINDSFETNTAKIFQLTEEDTFTANTLEYRYGKLSHPNSLEMNVNELAKDIYNHRKPEKLRVYYLLGNGSRVTLFNGDYYKKMKCNKGNAVTIARGYNPYARKVSISLEDDE